MIRTFKSHYVNSILAKVHSIHHANMPGFCCAIAVFIVKRNTHMHHFKMELQYFVGLIFLFLHATVAEYNPGDKAPSFILPTLSDPLVYEALNNTNIKPPMIFHEFTGRSGFLEALWNDDSSIVDLLQYSPKNTHYVFFSSTQDAKKTAEWMKARFKQVIDKHFESLEGNIQKLSEKEDAGGQKLFFRRRLPSFPKPYRGIEPQSLTNEDQIDSSYIKPHNIKQLIRSFKKHRKKHHQKPRSSRSIEITRTFEGDESAFFEEEPSPDEFKDIFSLTTNVENKAIEKEKFLESWLKRLHFVTISVYDFGNWIPLVTSRWHGRVLDQISFEGKADGDVKFVAKRLDARYDWLPSPYTLREKHPKTKIVDYGDGCELQEGINAKSSIILVSRKGKCSYFDKMQIATKAKALAVIVYTDSNQTLTDMTCIKEECHTKINLPGTMITYEVGQKVLALLKDGHSVYVRFQYTPTRNFFLAIDRQGKLQEVGWLLFPTMRFLTYQAEWMNFLTDLLKKIGKMEKTITIFDTKIMHGRVGVVKNVKMPSLDVLQEYSQVYLDMSLTCPGHTDYNCPHWDHTVQLFLDCGSSSFAGEEIGRWITPFRRRIGRWLTPIKPLIPMFTSTKCTFTMKTVPWAKPWKPSLRIQLADKIPKAKASQTLVPFKLIKLFSGGKFDKGYNKKYKPKEFIVPECAKKVAIFAVITGHGSDNHNCAEFCVTSHNFIVNKKYINTREFSNAGTPFGCADRVKDGVEPNEYGTWLYGRDGWCDGQEVDPWLEDITDQVKLNEQSNYITYHGYFNGKDPAPKYKPGYIIMHSFLVFYKPLED